MLIKELQLRNFPYKSRKGLAERLVKRYFEKRGYEVFRGLRVLGREFSVNYYEYENVRQKYDRMEKILYERLGDRLLEFRKAIFKAKGVPDFIVSKDDECFFVEVKLEHESLKPNQQPCLKLLESYGFNTAVIRVKSRPFRIQSEVNLEDKQKKVLVRQERLRLRYTASKRKSRSAS